MNDYQFDFIARTLLAILAAITQVAAYQDPNTVDWGDYNELYDKHNEWIDKKEEEYGHTK